VLLLLAAGTGREPFFDLAIVSAVLTFAGSLAYARFLERWL
jgi:multicomponent Na+:H+ antiporter subunit F